MAGNLGTNLTRDLYPVDPDISVHGEGDAAVQDGGVQTMGLLNIGRERWEKGTK